MTSSPSLHPGQPDPSDEPRRVSGIRRVHLVIWLGLAVTLIAIESTISATEIRALRRAAHVTVSIPWWMYLVRALVTMGFAACVVGSYELVRSGCFRMLSRLQPGHWLVLLLTLDGTLACIAVPFAWAASMTPPGRSWWPLVGGVVALSGLLLLSVSYGFAAVRMRDAARWRVLLGFGLVNVLLGGLLSAPTMMPMPPFWRGFIAWFGPCWWALLIVMAVMMVVMDSRRRIPRDRLHRLGISLWTLQSTSTLLLAIIAIALAKHGTLDASGTQVRLGGPPDSLPYERLGWDAEDFFSERGVVSLCRAIEARDLQKMERLVKSGVDVNAKGRGNMTPLFWAFPMGDEVFAKVLELGGDPNIRLTETRIRPVFVQGRSVTSLAALSDPVLFAWKDLSTENRLRLALQHGGNPNIEDLGGNTPIFYLTGDSAKLRARLRLLLDAGADINHRNQQGMTPLKSWFHSVQQNSIIALLEAGADYRIPDEFGLDFVLCVASSLHSYRKYGECDNPRVKSEIAALQPAIDWSSDEGVNWDAARLAVEAEEENREARRKALNDENISKEKRKALLKAKEPQGLFAKLPADYKHRPWLPQRPSLKKSDAGTRGSGKPAN